MFGFPNKEAFFCFCVKKCGMTRALIKKLLSNSEFDSSESSEVMYSLGRYFSASYFVIFSRFLPLAVPSYVFGSKTKKSS